MRKRPTWGEQLARLVGVALGGVGAAFAWNFLQNPERATGVDWLFWIMVALSGGFAAVCLVALVFRVRVSPDVYRPPGEHEATGTDQIGRLIASAVCLGVAGFLTWQWEPWATPHGAEWVPIGFLVLFGIGKLLAWRFKMPITIEKPSHGCGSSSTSSSNSSTSDLDRGSDHPGGLQGGPGLR